MSARRGRGFTLIELLVAISILAIVAVLGWRGLDGIVRARIALTAQMEQTRGMQLAFAQMQSDCEHLAGVGPGAKQLHGRPNLAADNDSLTLVRTVFAENEPSRVQVVSYRVKDGLLTRRESAATRDLVQLDVLWKAALGDTEGGGAAVALQSGVSGMAMRLWENGAWRAVGGNPAGGVGLEVGLRLEGQEIGLIKVFLLGAA